MNQADLALRQSDLLPATSITRQQSSPNSTSQALDQQSLLDHDLLSTVFPKNTLTPECIGLPDDLLNDTTCPV